MRVQKLGCTPLKKGINVSSVGNPCTKLFDTSTIKAIALSKK